MHAIVACYTDPKTSTPARLDEAGPWWHAGPGAYPLRKITAGVDVVICGKCRGIQHPAEPHDCNPTSTPEARALAREAATKARGEYERTMGDREARQDA